MKIYLIICSLVLVALIIIVKNLWGKKESNTNSKVTDIALPIKSNNDKIIIIKGTNYDNIKKASQQFCKMYNQQDTITIPNLTKISDSSFAITFPYDLPFDTFCFFVNYLYYPNDIFYKADIKAWATTKPTDIWITDKSANKKVMLYIPDDDKEYDNVYLTTQDNIGYKLGFAAGHEEELLNQPKEKYIAPTINLDDLKNRLTEEIK